MFDFHNRGSSWCNAVGITSPTVSALPTQPAVHDFQTHGFFFLPRPRRRTPDDGVPYSRWKNDFLGGYCPLVPSTVSVYGPSVISYMVQVVSEQVKPAWSTHCLLLQYSAVEGTESVRRLRGEKRNDGFVTQAALPERKKSAPYSQNLTGKVDA